MLEEAESLCGPSIIIAYNLCGYPQIGEGHEEIPEVVPKEAVNSGYWSLYRYNPLLLQEGKIPMTLDFKVPKFENMIPFMLNKSCFFCLQLVINKKQINSTRRP